MNAVGAVESDPIQSSDGNAPSPAARQMSATERVDCPRRRDRRRGPRRPRRARWAATPGPGVGRSRTVGWAASPPPDPVL